jgi:two-component system OmpR family response regulator
MKKEKKISVFLVDDDAIFLKVMETQFKERSSYEVKTFSTGDECLSSLYLKPDIIFLDYYLNPSNPKANTGLQVLDQIKAVDPNIHVVMLSSQDNVEVAINCMKHHAFDYIVKGESSFIRARKVISVLFYQNKLKEELGFYKTSSLILTGLIATIIFVSITVQIYYPHLMNK